MAEETRNLIVAGEQGKVLDNDSRSANAETTESSSGKEKTDDEKLVAWVIGRVSQWKQHRNANYSQQWDMYERLWRAIYSEEEKTRKTERSKIISPAISEAVENGAAEIEEAVFGRGEFFDISPEVKDDPVSVEALGRNEITFRQDLAQSRFTSVCSEITILGAVYGTGIGEIIQTEVKEQDITVATNASGQPQIKVVETVSERPQLVSVSPRNFIIDPAARNVDSALGVAVEEDVCSYDIRAAISRKEYKDVPVEAASSPDVNIKADPQMETPWMNDVVHVVRYYGKVPKHLLFPREKTENLFPDKALSDEPVDTEMVEARVFIANERHLLKALENPDMMGDRPIVAYQWDIVPGRFWGRGIVEKGATPAKLLDAELRHRIDSLAFTAAPLMAMDGTKLPRGFNFNIYPGKNLLLNGDPNTILRPMKFGELDQNSAPQVQMLDQMVQRATGSIDGTSLARQGVGGEARSGAVSMALAPIVKRNKRTLMRYINDFLGPTLRKLMWRYMQYDRERYLPLNMTFNVSSTMGIMQREYESANMVQMLSSMQPGTTEHLMILTGLIENSGMQHREKIVQVLNAKLEVLRQRELAPPVDPNAISTDPVVLQLQRIDAHIELAVKQAKLAEIQAKTRLLNAQANTETVEPRFRAEELALRGIYKTPEDQIDAEFDRRMQIADLSIKEKGIDSRERIADKQIIAARANEPKAEQPPEAIDIPQFTVPGV